MAVCQPFSRPCPFSRGCLFQVSCSSNLFQGFGGCFCIFHGSCRLLEAHGLLQVHMPLILRGFSGCALLLSKLFLFHILGGEASEAWSGLANSLGMPKESTETSLLVFFSFLLCCTSFFKVAAPFFKVFAPFFKVAAPFFKVAASFFKVAAPWAFFKATLLLSEGWGSSSGSCTFFKVSCTMEYSSPVKLVQSDWSPKPLPNLLTWNSKVPRRSALIWIQTEPLNLDVFRTGFCWIIWYRACLSGPGWTSADGTRPSRSFTRGSRACKAFGSTALFLDTTSYPFMSATNSSCLLRTLNRRPVSDVRLGLMSGTSSALATHAFSSLSRPSLFQGFYFL